MAKDNICKYTFHNADQLNTGLHKMLLKAQERHDVISVTDLSKESSYPEPQDITPKNMSLPHARGYFYERKVLDPNAVEKRYIEADIGSGRELF